MTSIRSSGALRTDAPYPTLLTSWPFSLTPSRLTRTRQKGGLLRHGTFAFYFLPCSFASTFFAFSGCESFARRAD